MDDDGSCRRKEADIKAAAYLSFIEMHHQTALLQHHQMASASLQTASGGGNTRFDVAAGFPFANHISPLWPPIRGAGFLPQQQVPELNAVGPGGLGSQQNFVPQWKMYDANSGTKQRALMEADDKSRIVKPSYTVRIRTENTVGVYDYKSDGKLPVDDKTSSVSSKESVRGADGAFDDGWCRSCYNRTGPCEAGLQNTCQVCICM